MEMPSCTLPTCTRNPLALQSLLQPLDEEGSQSLKYKDLLRGERRNDKLRSPTL